MMESSGKAQIISLGADSGPVIVQRGGIRVEFNGNGGVDVYSNAPVVVHPAANDDKPTVLADPQIGDLMPAGHPNAGWIYAGISKTTHEPFYVAPKDSGVFQWKEAMAFAAKDGSRVPSQEELDRIYEARDKGALKDTFNVSGSHPAGWYWSSRCYYDNLAWAQRFSDGDQYGNGKDNDSSLRCVR